MVETDPDSNNLQNSDVKDDRSKNGVGSKELELKQFTANNTPVISLSSTPSTPNSLERYKEKGLKDPEKGHNRKADFEEAIELAGYGR